MGRALDTIKRKEIIKIAPSLKQGFDKIYGYASSSYSIRHALADMKQVEEEDARFMLVACSAFVKYLDRCDPQISRCIDNKNNTND